MGSCRNAGTPPGRLAGPDGADPAPTPSLLTALDAAPDPGWRPDALGSHAMHPGALRSSLQGAALRARASPGGERAERTWGKGKAHLWPLQPSQPPHRTRSQGHQKRRPLGAVTPALETPGGCSAYPFPHLTAALLRACSLQSLLWLVSCPHLHKKCKGLIKGRKIQFKETDQTSEPDSEMAGRLE